MEMVLMNKNTPVVSFEYDPDIHAVLKINEIINNEYAPLSSINLQTETITKKSLNDWWQGRGVPSSRHGFSEALRALGISNTIGLLEFNDGLSMIDQYWIYNVLEPKKWEDINFFTNSFTDTVGAMLCGQKPLAREDLARSPEWATGGNLIKFWRCKGDERFLYKGSSKPYHQEPFNEIIATCLYERLLGSDDFVPYEIVFEENKAFSVCENMLNENQELISAYDLYSMTKNRAHLSPFENLVTSWSSFGVENAEQQLSKMIVCDYILANRDRHFGNFGIIRDVGSLEIVGAAPIFDSGSCLFNDRARLSCPKDFEYDNVQPLFCSMERTLSYIKDFSWFDVSALDGFVDEASTILHECKDLDSEKIDTVIFELDRRIDKTVIPLSISKNKTIYSSITDRISSGMDAISDQQNDFNNNIEHKSLGKSR